MAALKQSDRLLQFTSPLGKDVLLIESLEGAEGISRLFEFNAELLAVAGTEINPTQLIGNKVSVSIALNDVQGTRWVNGVVASFEQTSGDTDFDVYRARIVPSMWQLTLSANCRVFQNMTVMDIVKKVLGEYQLTLSDQTTGSYKPLDYCTQYSESDLHFVSRILEQYGIFYWFEHTKDDNKVMFGDARTAYTDVPLSATIQYEAQSGGAEGAYGSAIAEFSATANMVSGKHTTQDYDFRGYGAHVIPSVESGSDYGDNAFETYLYPAGEEGLVKETTKVLTTPDHGGGFVGARGLAGDAVAEIFRGSSNARSLCSGYTVTMTKHPRDAWNRKYLLTEVIHSASQLPPYRTDGADSSGGYHNRFAAVSSDIVYKPPIVALKPRIYGPQTALVVSPSGEEMFIDKLGRVCVQFFWDRARQPNTVDNTWVRVAQPWAGSGWGTFFWPRLKDEVVIQFLDGDPDNPVVVGSVYNGVNVPKYQLPDHSTRSGLVTRSSKGGSAANANELRLEDKTGSEQIFLNAERDMDHRTENDHRRFVGAKDSLIVKGAQYEQIDGDHHREVKSNVVEKVALKSDHDIGTDLSAKIGENYSLKVGMNHAEKVGMNYALDAGMEVYLKAGMTLVIESGMELCLKGAGGFISIGPAGIAISGTTVLINSGGAAVAGSPGQLTDPGPPTAPDQADDGTKGGAM